MLHRVSASGRDVSALEGMTIDAISLEVGCLKNTLAQQVADTHVAKQTLQGSPGNMWPLPSAFSRKSSANQPSGNLLATVWLPTSSWS